MLNSLCKRALLAYNRSIREAVMRRIIAATAFAAAFAAAMAAQAQTPPGVLIVGQIAEPKSLDPHAVTASPFTTAAR